MGCASSRAGSDSLAGSNVAESSVKAKKGLIKELDRMEDLISIFQEAVKENVENFMKAVTRLQSALPDREYINYALDLATGLSVINVPEQELLLALTIGFKSVSDKKKNAKDCFARIDILLLNPTLKQDYDYWTIFFLADDADAFNRSTAEDNMQSCSDNILKACYLTLIGYRKYLDGNWTGNKQYLLEANRLNPRNLIVVNNVVCLYLDKRASVSDFSVKKATDIVLSTMEIYKGCDTETLLLKDIYVEHIIGVEHFYCMEAKKNNPAIDSRLKKCVKTFVDLGFEESTLDSIYKKNWCGGALIFSVKGVDAGRNAWYIHLVDPLNLAKFVNALGDQVIHLEKMGLVLHSAYGDDVPKDLMDTWTSKLGSYERLGALDLQLARAFKSYALRPRLTTTKPVEKALLASSSQLSTIQFKELVVGEKLGDGGFNTLNKGTYKGEAVALKQFHNQNLAATLKKGILLEAEVHASLQHVNIIKLYGVCMEPVMFVSELFGGSLFDTLHDGDIPLNLSGKAAIVRGAAAGIAFLHQHDVLHLNISSSNVLLNDRMDVKLSDFGMTKLRNSNRPTASAYLAPELMQMDGECSCKTDIYSLGIVFWEIAARKVPYKSAPGAMEIMQHVESGNREEIPGNLPDKFSGVIKKCWHQDPNKRPTSQALTELCSRL